MSYRDLKSYKQATEIYDFTVEFTKRYIDAQSRTRDQMDQAARSGKQNIAEASSERTSEKSELFLLGVARASFEELLADFEDFLRQRGWGQWAKDDPRAVEVRQLAYRNDKSDKSYKSYRSYLADPEQAANAAICLIHQTNFLLDRQIKSAETQFIERGGYTENLWHQREEERKKQIVGAFWRKHS